MRNGASVAVLIPALNEESSIGKVISAVPPWVDDIVVADNGSTDRTAEIAKEHGARVVEEPRRGYGAACLTGIAALEDPDVVVFLDGDFSDHPEEMHLLVDPILRWEAEMVIGSRMRGRREAGALPLQSRFGNRLACLLIRFFLGARFTDLGPFRAIRHTTLKALRMRDRGYGWTAEMQVKAVTRGLRVAEVPVRYRRRIGKSKVSGTLRGLTGAGTKILFTILSAALRGDEGARGDRLIVFTRYPELGRAKTRLIPVLGAEGAADLQRRMSEAAIARAERLERERGVPVEIHYAGGDEGRMRSWLGENRLVIPQGEGDLGRRMALAFRAAFRSGAKRVVLMGTDCPDLEAEILEEAFRALDRHDVVLGPARDGGYYLVGLTKAAPALFEGIPWGRADVLKSTLRAARETGRSFRLLEPLDDVDRPEDLSAWEKRAAGGNAPKISVIVPALDEEGNISAALRSALRAENVEVIVADGGSRDGTPERARSLGARVVASPPGRARQMNAGAAGASGEILLFLHADTRLPEGYGEIVRRTLEKAGTAAGAFRLGIGAQERRFRRIERRVAWRCRLLQTPYGDQAIFLRSALFREIGGYPDVPLMEDMELVRRLRKRGRIRIADEAVLTSARRWTGKGFWRATITMQLCQIAYSAGVSPERLAGWYEPGGKE